ncbi:MAG: FecR domain-containing protein [Deltaproteobacteria bacterium]
MHPRRTAIDRLVLGESSPAEEARLRNHLRRCARCRTTFDELVVLARALAGDPRRPTRAEEERIVRRAIAGAGFRPKRPKAAFGELFVWHPFAATALALGLLLGLGAALRPLLHPAAPSRSVELARPSLPAPPRQAIAATAPPAPAGRLLRSRGARVDGHPAPDGSPIPAGARVEVGAEPAELEVARGGTLRLYPRSGVTVGAGGERVELERGKVWCVLEHNGRPFTVATDRGEARVRGTSFVVERRDDGDTDVRVVSGKVEVEDRAHRGELLVEGGQQSRLRAESPPSPPRHYTSARDRQDWDDAFSGLVRRLRRLIDGK